MQRSATASRAAQSPAGEARVVRLHPDVRDLVIMTSKAALAFVRRHGVVLESARGPVPNMAEAVTGEPIRGSWWGHPKGHAIFGLTRGIRESRDILVCRLVGGKITYVHRRLWPAVVRLAGTFAHQDLAAIQEIHTPRGRHELRVVPFPRWVPLEVKRRARQLTEKKARTALREIVQAKPPVAGAV